MSTTIYVLDTSYLIELAGCGRDSNPTARKRILRMFKTANAGGGRFFVPLPCLFELGLPTDPRDGCSLLAVDVKRLFAPRTAAEAISAAESNSAKTLPHAAAAQALAARWFPD